MSENIIYCYSGSGNCLDIAKNIAKKLGDTDIVMMRSAPCKTDASEAKRVGFVFPCYAGGLPGDVEKYLKDIKLAPNTYTFGIVSYSGYPGIGLSILNSIHPLDYWMGISHQCSCIWLFPHTLMMPKLSPEKAQARSEQLAEHAALDILCGKKSNKAPASNPLNALEASAWPKLCEKKAAKMTASSACVACGQCEKLCPKGNIKVVGGRAIFTENCIGCLSCLQYCPQKAIHLGGVTKTREHYHNPNVSADELRQALIHID